MTLQTIDLTPLIGTEIKTDKATLLSGKEAKAIRHLLEERGALVFRQINMTDEEQVKFAATIGNVMQTQGEKGIYKVTMEEGVHDTVDYLKGAFFWHFDGAQDDVPGFATLLSGRKLSPTGGETEFCNTYAAYEDLPEAEKKLVDTLQVFHNLEASQRLVHPNASEELRAKWQTRGPGKVHPMVWRHKSGRKSLIVGSTCLYVVGMDRKESDALLQRLEDWATQRKYVYQHKWTLGDLVIWDNTGTLHRATPYAFDSGRMMHRTALVGEEATLNP